MGVETASTNLSSVFNTFERDWRTKICRKGAIFTAKICRGNTYYQSTKKDLKQF